VIAAGDSTTINEIWDSAGATAISYSIVGYANYVGKTTDPQQTIICTKKPTGLIAY
jgi:hypothetical protein